MNKRLQSITNWLHKEDIDVLFINSVENVYYFSNFYTDPHERLMGVFVFKQADPLFILPGMEVNQLKDAGWPYEIIGYADHENPWDKLREAFKARNVTDAKKVSFEEEILTFSRANTFLDLFATPEVVTAESQLNELRLVKDSTEIAIMRRAAEMADYGVKVGVNALKEGVTELEVLAKIEYELKQKGVRDMSFSTMVLFGEKCSDPHGNPGEKQLQAGDMVLFDLGVIIDGYCSDITRTVAYQSVNDKQKDIYQTVLNAQLAALKASKPGTRIGDLDLTARKIITEAGYGDYFPHRLGHGLGISVHEFPSMSHLNDDLLQEGMVYTIEPGVYIPNVGGVRIEDDVLVTKDGCETLTKFPKELQIIT
ncbi:Xaa-Pro peptidase family protein [Gracilibacillus sp. S3-1-1]|uniref:Xaa-Pro peptidase family protein n=1 Tax=Gracilibacillus pellucidus TaxID=3095368 RepID=A0ACC6M382_9BACI|nr:Xaa-Pro peptidase family protein [Gracilibacillus sp. S3-1-1]MDX8045346.1 Xaa-Pro peptidase family protein [Gracilibacillus sp. S3-1-1]